MISVICPIYNEEKYIGKCIDSILRQDYPKEDMEVLLVDGMSTDKTREIVLSYCADYPFIRLLDNPRKIVPYAMNIGIQAAKGDIVIRYTLIIIFQNLSQSYMNSMPIMWALSAEHFRQMIRQNARLLLLH